MQIDLEQFTEPPSDSLMKAASQVGIEDEIGFEVDFNKVFQHFLSTRTFRDSISNFLRSCSITDHANWWKAPLAYIEEFIWGRPGYLYDLWIINENIGTQRIGVLVPKQELHTIGSTSVAHANTTFLMNILGIEQAKKLLEIGKFREFYFQTQVGHICIVKEKTIFSSSDGSKQIVYDIVHIL
ncbi:hypothetical protein ACFLY9_02900 [Patescibacteria group bacterium]